MRWVGLFLAAGAIIAAAQAVVGVLVVAGIVALLIALVKRPAETLGFVCLTLVIGLIQRQPLACLGLMVLAAIVSLVRRP